MFWLESMQSEESVDVLAKKKHAFPIFHIYTRNIFCFGAIVWKASLPTESLNFGAYIIVHTCYILVCD